MTDQIQVLSDDMRRRLAKTPVSAITTILSTTGFPRPVMKGVSPIDPGNPRMVGQAFTIRYIPSRPDLDTIETFSTPHSLQRIALERCPENFVLVVDARGDTSIACAGDAFVGRLQAKRCAGIVTDGGLRDAKEIRALEFPAFLGAPAPLPTFVGHHPVDINVPIGCGGVAVYPGDVVVGDTDGVVVIPFHMVEVVVEGTREIIEYDEFVEEQISLGRSLIGLYPATDESRAEYTQWRAKRDSLTKES